MRGNDNVIKLSGIMGVNFRYATWVIDKYFLNEYIG